MKIFEFILLILCVSMASFAFANTMVVNTGQGYFTYNGQPTSYYNLNPGNYSISNLLNYVETSSTPSVQINSQAFNSYVCTINPTQPEC